MSLPVNPIEFTAAGQSYQSSCRILAVVWEGSTTAGDTAELRLRNPSRRFWRGRANDINTYLGINWGPYGIHARYGFTLAQLSAGTVYVYLSEE